MHITQVAFLVSQDLLRDRLFDISAARDGILERFCLVKHKLNNHGIKCNTIDLCNNDSVDVLVLFDVCSQLEFLLSVVRKNRSVKIIYIPTEPPVISCLHTSNILGRMPFHRVLFWNDDFVSSYSHAVKCNIGQPIIDPGVIPLVPFGEKKFLVAISSSKLIRHKNGLHSERYLAFDFFSQKQVEFDLFGSGWDKVDNSFVRKSYRGACESKKDVLKKYKFSICFENAKDYPGLITEKIFDCFAAGTVPIYYGPPNIQRYIPEDCFINFCCFSNYEDLYRYIKNMSEEEYKGFLLAAKVFIQSNGYYEFTSTRFAEVLAEQVHTLLVESTDSKTLVRFKWDLIKIVFLHPLFILQNIKRCRRFLFDLFFRFWL